MLPLRHALLLVLVAFIWGTNFVVMRWALDEFPPLFVSFLRYFVTLIPFALFIKRPQMPQKYLIFAGLAVGAQFAFLFSALDSRITPGLASLIVQSQVFITIGLSLLLFKEMLTKRILFGISIAASGLMVIVLHLEKTVTALGVLLVLAAAMSWSVSNLAVKFAKTTSPNINMLGFTVWSSLYAMALLLPISLAVEGQGVIIASLKNASLLAWGSVFWQAIGNVMFGYGFWNLMLTRYPASRVTPFALLVPIFGLSSSHFLLGEAFPLWKALAALLVMLGLAVTTIHFKRSG